MNQSQHIKDVSVVRTCLYDTAQYFRYNMYHEYLV